MSSSTRCDAVSVSSQLDTNIAEVQPGALSVLPVMSLSSGMPEVLQDLHGLFGLHGTHLFYLDCSVLDDEALCSDLLG